MDLTRARPCGKMMVKKWILVICTVWSTQKLNEQTICVDTVCSGHFKKVFRKRIDKALVPKCLAITDGSNPNYFHMSPAHFCQNSNNMSKILISDLGAQTKNRTRKKGTQAYKWRRESRDLFGPESLRLLKICGIDVRNRSCIILPTKQRSDFKFPFIK